MTAITNYRARRVMPTDVSAPPSALKLSRSIKPKRDQKRIFTEGHILNKIKELIRNQLRREGGGGGGGGGGLIGLRYINNTD